MASVISNEIITEEQFTQFSTEQKRKAETALKWGQPHFINQIFSDYAEYTNKYLKCHGFDPMWLRIKLRGIFDVDVMPVLNGTTKAPFESTSAKIKVHYDGALSLSLFDCVSCHTTTGGLHTFTLTNDEGSAKLDEKIVHYVSEHGHYGFDSINPLVVARILYASQGIVIPSRITSE